jgi:hypothetical protein
VFASVFLKINCTEVIICLLFRRAVEACALGSILHHFVLNIAYHMAVVGTNIDDSAYLGVGVDV